MAALHFPLTREMRRVIHAHNNPTYGKDPILLRPPSLAFHPWKGPDDLFLEYYHHTVVNSLPIPNRISPCVVDMDPPIVPSHVPLVSIEQCLRNHVDVPHVANLLNRFEQGFQMVPPLFRDLPARGKVRYRGKRSAPEGAVRNAEPVPKKRKVMASIRPPLVPVVNNKRPHSDDEEEAVSTKEVSHNTANRQSTVHPAPKPVLTAAKSTLVAAKSFGERDLPATKRRFTGPLDHST